MARTKKVKTDETKHSSLEPALDFLAPLLISVGDPNDTHVLLHNSQAIVWNGTIAAGHPIEEQLSVVVHGLDLRSAVGRAGAGLVLAIEPPLLTISAGAGGRLRVRLPMLPLDQIAHAVPDPMVMPLGEELRNGWETIAHLATDGNQRVICASVGMRSGSMVATDGAMFIEYWHGLNLPVFNMPKKTIAYLCKIKQPMIGFGFSGSTATFYFEGGAWVRTQLYVDGWEKINPEVLFQGWDYKGQRLPTDLWEAFDNVKLFVDRGEDPIFFIDGGLSSTKDGATGAFCQITDSFYAPQGCVFAAKYLAFMRMLEPTVVNWFVGPERDRVAFTGDKIRGAIVGMRQRK